MGTSQSSRGPAGKVPIIPPWVPDLPEPEKDGEKERPKKDKGDDKNILPNLIPRNIISAPRRFQRAKLNLGRFADSGNSNSLKAGIGNYVKTGYGGHASRRMNSTAVVAGALYSILNNGIKTDSLGAPIDQVELRRKNSKEIIDVIIEAVRPIDGTQDSEANRYAIRDALSELLKKDENTDLTNLSDEQQIFVIQSYISSDIFRRFDLDIGVTIREKASTLLAVLSRLKEVKDYIRQTVEASFRKLDKKQKITSTRIIQIIKTVLNDTFKVFEEFAS